jgi:hypothetical protein
LYEENRRILYRISLLSGVDLNDIFSTKHGYDRLQQKLFFECYLNEVKISTKHHAFQNIVLWRKIDYWEDQEKESAPEYTPSP